ncbi:MAG TPA: LysM peptidoglycan-binding domain-containing protein [Planctomycetaceae bacterium]|nr:LysM peptidoglycan-binding domain-containing protein [Planctomycetaceae bacterium]
MVSPLDSLRQGFVKAYLEIEQPVLPDSEAIVPVRFNPSEYQLQKQNSYADINIPGLETPPIQFVRGDGEKLTTELLVDTSDTLEDVRKKYVNRIRGLMNIQSELHAPPIVRLVWDQQVFRGVMDSLTITYVMFRPDGVPLRAKLAVSLKEYRPVEIQVREQPRLSPDFDKIYTVLRGDTLSSIAARVFRDATVWREIARANNIRDPRRLEPGRILTIPKLR